MDIKDENITKTLSMKKRIFELKKQIKATLIEKNKLYGDAALNPKRIISKAPSSEGIAIRLDDKINRILNGPVDGKTKKKVFRKNDVFDIMGYCILYMISRMREVSTEKLTFPKEVDEAIEVLSTPNIEEPETFYKILANLQENKVCEPDLFFECLDEIIEGVKGDSGNVLVAVPNLFLLCIHIAAYYDFMNFEDQID